MKRRWGIPAAANEVVDVVAIEHDTQGDQRRESGPAEVGQEVQTGAGMEMEMEGWDGVGERPLKRIARNFRRELDGSDEEGDASGTSGGGGGPRGEESR